MRFTKISLAGAALLTLGLSGCATATGYETSASSSAASAAAARHDHQRDAKQNWAAPLAPKGAARKPLHDHREFK